MIGLSATLPNYLDVALFLNVNFYKGLFYFDGRFRPVPLTQCFVGVKATSRLQQLRDMDSVCYDKVLENVRNGNQVGNELLCRYMCPYWHRLDICKMHIYKSVPIFATTL